MWKHPSKKTTLYKGWSQKIFSLQKLSIVWKIIETFVVMEKYEFLILLIGIWVFITYKILNQMASINLVYYNIRVICVIVVTINILNGSRHNFLSQTFYIQVILNKTNSMIFNLFHICSFNQQSLFKSYLFCYHLI